MLSQRTPTVSDVSWALDYLDDRPAYSEHSEAASSLRRIPARDRQRLPNWLSCFIYRRIFLSLPRSSSSTECTRIYASTPNIHIFYNRKPHNTIGAATTPVMPILSSYFPSLCKKREETRLSEEKGKHTFSRSSLATNTTSFVDARSSLCEY